MNQRVSDQNVSALAGIQRRTTREAHCLAKRGGERTYIVALEAHDTGIHVIA